MIARLLISTAILITTFASGLFGQNTGENDYNSLWLYRIYFTDKGGTSPGDFTLDQLFSQRAVERRIMNGAGETEWSDLPVSTSYCSQVVAKGFGLRSVSRWMNTGLFSSPVPGDTAVVASLPFVRKVKLVKIPTVSTKGVNDKLALPSSESSAADFYNPAVPLNGTGIHSSGFDGKGILMAVLDAGFMNADRVESLEQLRNRGGIIATRDFVNRAENVYAWHGHGTAVLTVLAGTLPGIIEGTGPGADFLLLRSEDDASEFPAEEDYWAAAAEYADSAGADIISSSLGYFNFDDPSMNYEFSDFDGDRAFITAAADRAASKGILVVASAGNERNKKWLRILAPSDGDSVMSIGAVTHDLTVAPFSSAGYSADGRVKPDVVAPGTGIPVQYEPGKWQAANGTSFSCPVISGMCASLMQAVRNAKPQEIASAVRKSADRYNNPDSLYGYGLPDFSIALSLLEEKFTFLPDVSITAGPNPFTETINLWFMETPENLSVTLTDMSGRTVLREDYEVYVSRAHTLKVPDSLAQGVYFVHVGVQGRDKVFRMVRIRR